MEQEQEKKGICFCFPDHKVKARTTEGSQFRTITIVFLIFHICFAATLFYQEGWILGSCQVFLVYLMICLYMKLNRCLTFIYCLCSLGFIAYAVVQIVTKIEGLVNIIVLSCLLVVNLIAINVVFTGSQLYSRSVGKKRKHLKKPLLESESSSDEEKKPKKKAHHSKKTKTTKK